MALCRRLRKGGRQQTLAQTGQPALEPRRRPLPPAVLHLGRLLDSRGPEDIYPTVELITTGP